MKTIKKGTEIRRVKDEQAFEMTHNGCGDWKYCPKSEYKKLEKTK